METTLEIFEFVRGYLLIHPWSPTLQEIADGCGLAWPSSVVRHLDHLQQWGFIDRQTGRARGICLTEKGRRFSTAFDSLESD